MWDWKELSLNQGLPWDEQLIDSFSDKFVWSKTFLAPIVTPEGEEIPGLFSKENESGLVSNEALPWSLSFILKYKNQIDFKLLFDNNAVWEKALKKHVDRDMISLILRII